MSGGTSAILAIALLGVVALTIGGLAAMRRPADRKRGWLMLAAAAVLLGNVLILAWPV